MRPCGLGHRLSPWRRKILTENSVRPRPPCCRSRTPYGQSTRPLLWTLGPFQRQRLPALGLLVGLALGDALNRHLQMGHADTIRRKIVSSFSIHDQRRIKEIRSRVRIGGLASHSVLETLEDPSNQVSDQLKEAFALNHALRLHYVDQKGALTERLFEPHYLMLNPPVWYAVGWDHLRDAARTFRTDRIKDAKVSKATFTPRPWSDFAESMENNPTRAT